MSAVIVIVALLVFTGVQVLLPGLTPRSFADTAVQIADPVPDQSDGLPPNTPTRAVYHTQTTSFSYSGGYVVLSNCPDLSCGMVADDGLKLTVTRSDGTSRQVEFDFYTHEFPPANVTALFGVGNNTVKAELLDLMGPQYGSSHPFFLVSSATAPAVPTLLVEPPPPGTEYNYPWLFTGVSDDPVNTLTGSYSYSFTDLAVAGRGPSPAVTRAYNSNDPRVGPLGPGWMHNYAARLVSPAPDSTDLVLVGPEGRSDRYTSNGDNSYTPPPGVYTTLKKNDEGTYTATFKDQTTWVFSATGKLLRIVDRFGNVSLLEYNSQGQLISVSDPAGRGKLTFAYDAASGRLASIKDWMSPARTVTYGYDSQGRLASVTDREGKVTTYGYDGASHRLVSITDANGHVAVTNTYDSESRVATQKDARGLVTGQQTVFQYNTNSDGTKTTVVTYPQTSLEPSWNHREEDTHDAQGRLTKRVAKPTSNSTEWVTTEYTWDSQSNRTAIKDGQGNTTLYCYDIDHSGATVADSLGNMTRQIEPAAEPGGRKAVTLFKYDGKNNLVQAVSPNGVNSNSTVDCTTNLSGAVSTAYVTDWQYDADTQTKLLSETRKYTDPDTGPTTIVTKYEYGDGANPGRVTRIVPPRGNTGPTPDYSYATTLEYYGSGSQAGMLQRQTDPNGGITTHGYDEAGRQTSMVDPNGNASGANPVEHTWRYVYDKEDRLRFAIAPAPQIGSSPLVSEARYDAVGNLEVSIDPNGQLVKNLYDERDALKEVQESPDTWNDPNVVPSRLIRTEYQYDHRGNLSRLVRAKGDTNNERATDYAYDGLGRTRKEVQYPAWPSTSGALVTEDTYDLNSNLRTHKDALGRITTYGYDARDFLRSLTYSDGVTPNVQYAYDLNRNRLTMTDGTGTTTYAYDELNRMLSVTSPSVAGLKTVGYRYDLDGNREKLIYPDGTAVVYTFDKGSRMASLKDWANRLVSYSYFADGSLRIVANPNGTSEHYTYDNAQRLKEVWNKSGGNTISRHTYTMDAAANRTRVDEVLPENGAVKADDVKRQATTIYGYDRLYQLTSESGPDVNTAYTYDPVGNRVLMVSGTKKQTSVTYSYDRADRLTQVGSDSVIVDANGNMVARGKETYTYDQANRLVRSKMPQPTQYIYNGDGQRVTTDAGQGPLTTHVYDVNRSLPVLLEDGRRKYVWGLDLVYAAEGNGTLEVYHTDGLGSVRAVTYPNGNVTQNYRTDAFGVVVKRQGTSNQPFQFAGEERDKETGFYYLRARYYDPSMGRFLQRDPFAGMIANPLSLNRYTYVENNPVGRVDPSGLASSRIISSGGRYASGYAWWSLGVFGTLSKLFDQIQPGLSLPGEKLLRVSGYLRANGTRVAPYSRTVPGGALWRPLTRWAPVVGGVLDGLAQWEKDAPRQDLSPDTKVARTLVSGFGSWGFGAAAGALVLGGAAIVGAPVVATAIGVVAVGYLANLAWNNWVEPRVFQRLGLD
ncbi:MAG: DUF6531 domain-containing protein [Chloroflexota bacterium]|nr:DUF6531 domain-containing protein [Chloroflexota bacterium]